MKRIAHPAPWHAYWSVRLALLAAILAAMQASLPLWNTVLPPQLFSALAAVVGTLAAIARMCRQDGLLRYVAPDAPAITQEGAADATESTH